MDARHPILVTGANGFLGAWTLRRLHGAGWPLLAFDLQPAGTLAHRLLGRELDAVRWHVGDIVDAAVLARAAEGCGGIVHLAAVLTPFCREQPVRGAMVNVIGTLNVFEVARALGHRQVVYASSAAVHGPDARHTGPATLYGVYKLACEGIARAWWHEHGVASVGLRPFVVYGPGRDAGASAGISLACEAAAQGRPYTVPFSGCAGMVYVGDVADAVLAALTLDRKGAQVHDLVGEVCSVEQVIAAIRHLCPGAALDSAGPPLGICVDGMSPSRWPGTPPTSLSDGIARTVAFCR